MTRDIERIHLLLRANVRHRWHRRSLRNGRSTRHALSSHHPIQMRGHLTYGVTSDGGGKQSVERIPQCPHSAIKSSMDVTTRVERCCPGAGVRQPGDDVLRLCSSEAQAYRLSVSALNENGGGVQEQRIVSDT